MTYSIKITRIGNHVPREPNSFIRLDKKRPSDPEPAMKDKYPVSTKSCFLVFQKPYLCFLNIDLKMMNTDNTLPEQDWLFNPNFKAFTIEIYVFFFLQWDPPDWLWHKTTWDHTDQLRIYRKENNCLCLLLIQEFRVTRIWISAHGTAVIYPTTLTFVCLVPTRKSWLDTSDTIKQTQKK